MATRISRRAAWPLLLTLFAVSSSLDTAFADPFFGDLYSLRTAGLTPLIFGTTIGFVAECAAMLVWLGPHLTTGQILRAFVWINLITFVPTQIVGVAFSWLAELIPLIVEPLLYRGVARRAGVEIPGLTRKVVLANVLSFFVGLGIYYSIGIAWAG